MNKSVLILSIGFRPNLGGVESHLDDLICELNKKKWKVTVLTYQPVQAQVLGKWIEKSKQLTIYRLPVIRGLFYKLVKIPLFEFGFLSPLLFLATPFVLLTHPDISVINAQGLIAGFSASIWAKVFNKRYVVATQSIYHFPSKGAYRKVVQWIFGSSDKILAISRQSGREIASLGIDAKKIVVFTHWVDLKRFCPRDKNQAKTKFNLVGKFVVSFVGRLIPEKGVKIMLEASRLVKSPVVFVFDGSGSMEDEVKRISEDSKNVVYLGRTSKDLLPYHYNAADILVVPSVHEEGFGRIILEALSSGTPVIGSKRGGIVEAMDESVGRLIDITPKNIANIVDYLYYHSEILARLARNTRKYALKRFSSRNADTIISSFLDKSTQIR